MNFILNPSSILVSGKTKALLCDMERGRYYYIPLSLYEILSSCVSLNKIDICDKYSKDSNYNENIIDEYFDFLNRYDLISSVPLNLEFKNSQPYGSINFNYDYPGYISNSIIDISRLNLEYLEKYFLELDNMLCQALQLRILVDLNELELVYIFDLLKPVISEWIEILIPFQIGLSFVYLEEKLKENSKIKSIIVYNSERNDVIYDNKTCISRLSISVKSSIERINCGIVSMDYFASGMIGIIEAMNHNSCLNRKISIDTEGNIKNCPSMPESFGNIRDTTLMEAIEKPGFKKYWDINKDKIYVCKDCEFRYVCTDCRAYVEDPADILSKPLKCGYNPYTGEWSEWSTNPLKQKAINFYGMQELVAERKIRLDQEQHSSEANE